MATRITITDEMASYLKRQYGTAAEAAAYTVREILPGLDAKLYFKAKRGLMPPFPKEVTIDLKRHNLEAALTTHLMRLREQGVKSVTKTGLMRVGLSIFCDEIIRV